MRTSNPARPWLTAVSLAGATTLLFPLLAGYSWYLLVVGIVVGITAVHWGLRRLGVPDLLVTLASVTMLLFALTALNARDVAPLGFWPGPAALAELRHIARTGMSDAVAAAAPAAPTVGLVLLVALAIGALTVLAHALDEFDDLLGLGWPSLLVYASAAAVLRHPVPWLWFAVAAATWLLLVAGREAKRLQGFGPLAGQVQNLIDDAAPSHYVARTGSSARRAGAAALAIAVIVPILLPAGHRLNLGGHGGTGSGGSGGVGAGLVSIDPTVSLRRDLISTDNRVLLTYRGSYANGADAGPTYLRMDVLDAFDGVTWTYNSSSTFSTSIDQPLPAPIGLSRSTSLTGPVYTISVGPLDGHTLPVPALTGHLVVSGDWFYDTGTQTVRTIKDSPAGKSYTIQTWDSSPTPDQLRAAPPVDAGQLVTDLNFPSDTPAGVIQLAHQVTANAHTQYDAAIALQAWLRTFTYSTSVQSGDGTSALLTFLRDRVGYCQQFAATMALFARILGIPARVAVGFAPGSLKADGTYQVTVHDAHSWPELFFQGIGWVRFEPTPRDASTTGIAPPTFTPPPSAPSSSNTGTKPEGTGKTKSLNRADGGGVVGPNTLALVTAKGAGDSGRTITLAVLVLLLLLVPITRRVRRWLYLRRHHTGVELAWATLRSRARDLGSPLPLTLTPRQVGDRLADLAPDDSYLPSIDRLVAGVERSRYTRQREAPDLRHDMRNVLRGLRNRASWSTRFRALLLPGVAD